MSPRGGKRDGSGRPPKPPEKIRQTLNCRVTPQTINTLHQLKNTTNKSYGQLVDLAVDVLKHDPSKLPTKPIEED